MSGSAPRAKAAEIINTALDNISKLTPVPLTPDQVLATAQAQGQLATAAALLAMTDAIKEGSELLASTLRKGMGGYTS